MIKVFSIQLQSVTEASEREKGHIHQALFLKLAKYRTAWPVQPLTYSQKCFISCRFR